MELKITSYKLEQDLTLYDYEQFEKKKIVEHNQIDQWLYNYGYIKYLVVGVVQL